MALGAIVIIILVVLVIAALPNWQYSRAWGYGPTGALGFILLVTLLLVLTGRI